MSRYVVTGATGFLGRHLVHALLSRRHTVVALARAAAPDLPAEVEILQADIVDRGSVEQAFQKACADGLFHCAGKVSRRLEDAEELQRIHVQGTRHVLDAAIACGIRRAVYASTSGTIAVSEDPDQVSTEDNEAPIGPIAIVNRWPYYRTKLFAEKAALERHGAALPNGGTFSVVCVNPTLLLGPGDVHGSSTEDVRLFLERKIPAIPSGGMSYVDARDAAEGMCLAMDRGTGGRRYLLGACNLTIGEFFGRLERISGVRGPRVPMPGGHRVREITRTAASMLEQLGQRIGIDMGIDPISIDMAHFYWYLDATRAEIELGWTPRDPIATLADTVADLRDRGVVWPDLGASTKKRDS
ncbi:MAG: NAD-dependent epimerase/dehydratase family protein [Polyangiaceae bacterium]|nr:NAD-dependent epimerase/dehydratase family protein [Polyangiaceae bacterium]